MPARRPAPNQMPRHTETRALPFAPTDIFDLVADIERYPEFLPWCTAARVRDRKPDGLLADLEIGYRIFVETFTSRVTLRRPGAIDVVCERGPFRHLRNAWRFAPSEGGGLRAEVRDRLRVSIPHLGAHDWPRLRPCLRPHGRVVRTARGEPLREVEPRGGVEEHESHAVVASVQDHRRPQGAGALVEPGQHQTDQENL